MLNVNVSSSSAQKTLNLWCFLRGGSTSSKDIWMQHVCFLFFYCDTVQQPYLQVQKLDIISFAFLEPNEFQITPYGLQQVVDF